MIDFSCPRCQKKLKARDEVAGKKVKCPGCGHSVGVPEVGNSSVRAPEGHGPREAEVGREVGKSLGVSTKGLIPAAPPVGESPTLPPAALGDDNMEEGSELIDFLAPPQAPDELGRLGPYRVLKVLGHGGMGVVYKAEDPQLKRAVALKAMLPSLGASVNARKRFLREAQAAAAVKHDHIVTIHQVGEDRGAPFLAMEFLQGEPLDERLRQQARLPLAEVLRIGREIAEGLEAAHACGLIHRDIKPANVWLEGKKGRVKILDFGLARAADDQQHLTQSGAIVGTPAYMAPEQAQGNRVDARCDLFSLGCVLYRLCTGEMPFKGSDTISTLMAVATENPRPPQEVSRDVPKALSDLVMRLLGKKPEDRPASAQHVVEALAAIESEQADLPTATAKAGKRPIKRKVALTSRRSLLLVAVGVLLAGGLTAGLYLRPRPADQGTSQGAGLDARKETDKSAGENKNPLLDTAFVSLFNGTDLAGWDKFGKGEWVADKGVLCAKGQGVGWLGTQREYGDFELELEYRLPPKGNSGIFVHAWPDGKLSGTEFLEVQLIHEAINTFGKDHDTAAICAILAPNPSVKTIPDTWHKVGIKSQGRHLLVVFDGQQVIDANLDEYAKRRPGLAKTTGRIGLQCFNTKAEFRNIQVRDLTPGASGKKKPAAAK